MRSCDGVVVLADDVSTNFHFSSRLPLFGAFVEVLLWNMYADFVLLLCKW